MPNGEIVLSDKEIIKKIDGAAERERVSPLDPDFLVFVLPFALIVDTLDIIFEFASFIVLPKIIGIAFDVFTFAVIGGWIYWRVGRIVKSREEQKKALQKTIAKKGATLERQLARGLRSPLRRALTRAGITFLGEIAPLVGLVPFWTISVILTLREK